jgi:uridine kinase
MIFSSPDIRNLCSSKIFIRTTTETILKRYTYRTNDYSIGMRYLTDLVFPNLDAYMDEHASHADVVLDGTKPFDVLEAELFSHIEAVIHSSHSLH